jgi:hypothetical protein
MNPLIKSISKTYNLIEEDVAAEWEEIREELGVTDEKIGASVILKEFKARYSDATYKSQFNEAKDIVKFTSEQKKKLLKYCSVKVGAIFHQALLTTGTSPEGEAELLNQVIEKFIKEEPMNFKEEPKEEPKKEKQEESFFEGESFSGIYKKLFK